MPIQTSNKQEANRPTKPVVATDKPVVTKPDRFGGASNAKIVAWNTSKKNTASVSVSAVPVKESPQMNKTATVSPIVTNQQPTGSVNAVATAAKSPVPTKQTVIKQEKPTVKPEEIKRETPIVIPQATQAIEVKKVEQQNKEVTANVTEKKQTLSLAPPPPPTTSNDDNKQAPAKSWASLFAGGASTPKPTSLPTSSAVVSTDLSKRPIAKVSPYDSTSTTAQTATPYLSSAQHGFASQTNQLQKQTTNEKKPVADEYSLKLSNFLQNYKIDNNSISIFPRGLINRSNYCYINGILQALVSCPPFYHLMRDMPKLASVKSAKGCTPILEAM